MDFDFRCEFYVCSYLDDCVSFVDLIVVDLFKREVSENRSVRVPLQSGARGFPLILGRQVVISSNLFLDRFLVRWTASTCGERMFGCWELIVFPGSRFGVAIASIT